MAQEGIDNNQHCLWMPLKLVSGLSVLLVTQLGTTFL